MVPGTSLKDRYRLARFPLAHRGMSEVWPAHDALLDRPVIVKFVAVTELDLVRRFRREALLTARLDHPGVPAVYDLGEHAGHPYAVLQKITGVTLSDLVAEHGPLPIAWVAAVGAQIGSVLLAAQRLGLVHRDIKPSNAMLEPSGAVKVLDFGLAVMPDDDRYSRITQSGQALGTIGYMAPEQILGQQADHRADLYGLGATLFDLLTGSAPFDGLTTMTTVRQQIAATPPRPATLRPETPAALDDLVHSLLAPTPDDRPDSAADVYRALAPLAADLPPIPGVLDESVTAVQAYAAIVGRTPPPHGASVTPTDQPSDVELEQAVRQAEQMQAAGEFRAAARQWRRLAEHRARQHGDDDPQVFDLRLRAARTHLALGEHDRAVRQLTTLLAGRERVDGPDHPAVRELREEIARLSVERAGPLPLPQQYAPDADR
ncbi:protein kinase [Micromonospora sp. C95]|uniref:protein kinase domain-containing protein n=1 Tax=Micromonospora sp. C95 TaxID=2824882 RepID=UPI0027DE75D3|nr:protein kinase [Micromonospora sp. C95]